MLIHSTHSRLPDRVVACCRAASKVPLKTPPPPAPRATQQLNPMQEQVDKIMATPPMMSSSQSLRCGSACLQHIEKEVTPCQAQHNTTNLPILHVLQALYMTKGCLQCHYAELDSCAFTCYAHLPPVV
jgi:predicted nucleic-acid-binding Zn-ribbon protein